MVRLGLTATLAVSVCLVLGAPPASSTTSDAGDLLPDLKALKASRLKLKLLPGDVRLLRFTTDVANLQTGPLELQPVADDCDGNGDPSDDRTALQRIYHDDDANGYFTRGVDVSFRLQPAGCFYYHEEHKHWHFENFANYRLHAFNEDGSIGPIVGSSDKISFCMRDSLQAKPGVPGSPPTAYYTDCGPDTVSGISAGWADRYERWLPDQHIDVTGLGDGEYCLVLQSDPTDRLDELDELNNDSKLRIKLIGDEVRWRRTGPC